MQEYGASKAPSTELKPQAPGTKHKTFRGQASLDHLVVTALGLAFVTVVFYLAFNLADDNIRVAQARNAVDKIGKTADYVYSLGPGSRDSVKIYLPNGISTINVTGRRVYMRVSAFSGTIDVFVNTRAILVGNITSNQGPQEIFLSANLTGANVIINSTG